LGFSFQIKNELIFARVLLKDENIAALRLKSFDESLVNISHFWSEGKILDKFINFAPNALVFVEAESGFLIIYM